MSMMPGEITSGVGWVDNSRDCKIRHNIGNELIDKAGRFMVVFMDVCRPFDISRPTKEFRNTHLIHKKLIRK